MDARVLAAGDAPALEAFLASRADSSMFLLSNAQRAGLVDRGRPYEATYVAGFSSGRIIAVVAHAWNGMLVLQAPTGGAALASLAVTRSGRDVAGLTGPAAQVQEARKALGLDRLVGRYDSVERLYGLDLDQVVVPEPLRNGTLACRAPRPNEIPIIVDWRIAYGRELLGAKDSPFLAETSRREIEILDHNGDLALLLDAKDPVAFAAINAAWQDLIQLGGVWTPPQHRSKGYGRAAIAGLMLMARPRGVRRAVLFTGETNLAAQRAYQALGFRPIGDYAVVLFGE